MKLLFCLFLVLCSGAAFSQNASITGQATDTAGNVLTSATVMLERFSADPPFRRTISQKSAFAFRNLVKGEYALTISYTEYRDTTIRISIQEKDSIYNIGQVKLQDKQQLVEVVVRAVIPPVIMKSDTIVYNAASYKTPPNASVEELLKKLPGMEVDKDGNITFQGEKVQKIYIDGKEFFLNDPKLATKNFLADMVTKVEAFNEKSERSKRTGMPEATTTKAINLRLKPGKNKGLFGNANAAVGTGDRYSAGGSANYFRSDRNFMSSFGINNGGDLMNGQAALPNAKSKSAMFNFSTEINSKLKVGVGYTGMGNSFSGKNTSERQSFFPDSSLLQSRASNMGNDMESHSANLNMDYVIDSFNTLKVSGSFSYSKNEGSSSEMAESSMERDGISKLLNQAQNRNMQGNSNTSGNITIDYSRTFRKKGRFFQATINPGLNRSNGDGELFSITQFFNQQPGTPDNIERNQRSTQKGSSNSLNASITYAEPLSKQSALDINYAFAQTGSYDDRLALNYDETSGKYDTPDSLATNYLTNDNGSHSFSLGYNYYKNKLQYQLGGSVQHSRIANTNTAQALENISQNTTNLFPRASMMYNIDKKKVLQFSYQGSTNQPSIEQLQPAPDYNNPLIVRKGNPDLKQSFNNNGSLSYRAFDPIKSTSISAGINFRTTINEIVSSSITTAGGIQEIQYLNTNGNYSLSANGSYSFPLAKSNKKANASINSTVGYSNGLSFVNGQATKRSAKSFSPSVRLNYAPGEKLVTGFNGSLNWNHSTYSLPGSQSSTMLNYNYEATINYEVLRGLILNTDVNMQINRSTPQLGGQDITVWNARVSKMLFKRNGELKFSVYDILNNNRSIYQHAADNYIEKMEREVVQRVYVLSFTYRFRKFGI